MSTLSIAVIPGDGIGQEVIPEALRVLDAVAPLAGIDVALETVDLGSSRYLATGELLPLDVVEHLKTFDAILFGAIGDPRVPSGVLERGIILPLRSHLRQFLNLRPVRLYPGVVGPLRDKSPDDIDFVVCREGTEGPYSGAGGSLREGTPEAVVTEVSLHTRMGVERIIRDAFERARRRRNKVTMVAKTNVLVHSGKLWLETFDAVASDYPDVETDYAHVDAAAMYFVTSPERFDVVVADNLFGDILTDIGAAIMGGIGLAASGNIDPTGENPSMFEPVHGSAPDIAGQGLADPTAAVLSLAMLLDHTGHREAAGWVEQGVLADLAVRGRTRRGTREVGDALLQNAVAAATGR